MCQKMWRFFCVVKGEKKIDEKCVMQYVFIFFWYIQVISFQFQIKPLFKMEFFYCNFCNINIFVCVWWNLYELFNNRNLIIKRLFCNLWKELSWKSKTTSTYCMDFCGKLIHFLRCKKQMLPKYKCILYCLIKPNAQLLPNQTAV